jgi:molybdopterin converting factor small subunit
VKVTVHILIKGRIGDGWYDIDRNLKVPAGTTLGQLVAIAASKGVPLGAAIADSPHLAHTLMWNGDRCPVDEHRDREIADGDEIYLLAPLAGG